MDENPALSRRAVLQGAIAVSAVGVGTTVFGSDTMAATATSFSVVQGESCHDVTPLARDQPVEDFYGYAIDGSPHSHTETDIERSDVSNLFLYDGPNGLSLVVQHDEPNDAHGTDSGGGAVSFDITGLPSGGQWVVRDDGEIGATDTSPDWAWAQTHTDGGAWRGGLACGFEVTIDPAFNDAAERDPLTSGTIDEWHLLSGDPADPDRTPLAMDQPVTIRCGACTIGVGIEIKPMEDPNPVNPNARGVIPVAIVGTDSFDPGDRVDVGSLRFGDPEDVDAGGGATAAHGGHVEDVDGDGTDDLVVHFPARDAGFDGDETTGKLVGETTDGTPLVGTDSVTIVGGGRGKGP